MCSALREIEVHNREGTYDHSTNTRVYDGHGVTLGTIRLKADWGRRGLGLNQTYLVYGHSDNGNNRQNDNV